MNPRLPLLLSAAHPCPYLPRREARNLLIHPGARLTAGHYQQLLDQGFRRSGDIVYRPHCGDCRACVPVRIDSSAFSPDRSQRRCLRANADLVLKRGTTLNDEDYALYRRYLIARHADGGMDPDDRAGFESLQDSPWGGVELWRFRRHGQLLACAVVDRLPDGYSAAYTFFEPAPEWTGRSLGTYAVLRQIGIARDEGRRWLWLGFWIDGCATMAYKARFRPQEQYRDDRWRRIAHPGRIVDNPALSPTG